MSDHPINDPQPTPSAPVSVDASAPDLASARRRRFIKMGAGVIPVALTLSSRPVLATNSQGKCFSASAWGSIQTLIGTNASQYTRKANNAPTVTCYTLAEWIAKASSTKASCGGWKITAISCADLSLTTVKKYSVYKACGSTGGTGGVGSSYSVWDMLSDSHPTVRCSSAQKSLLVAWLNFRISGATRTDVCVIDSFSTNQLTLLGNIVAGTASRGPDGRIWTAADVQTYLERNYIGRLS
ncbi:MAG: hypothetical protein DI603_15580 [Roseateles depolymerans]|uniref:Uncharacterized protein n=1 Tax=Roseateles depolymerans TaxID=76731 RepID=A0A2W5DHB3_9BURK|nr:MAG: hypothetical protein DI603_15580 [Roseateles depolymerans]